MSSIAKILLSSTIIIALAAFEDGFGRNFP
jgi:hypothetical protein